MIHRLPAHSPPRHLLISIARQATGLEKEQRQRQDIQEIQGRWPKRRKDALRLSSAPASGLANNKKALVTLTLAGRGRDQDPVLLLRCKWRQKAALQKHDRAGTSGRGLPVGTAARTRGTKVPPQCPAWPQQQGAIGWQMCPKPLSLLKILSQSTLFQSQKKK